MRELLSKTEREREREKRQERTEGRLLKGGRKEENTNKEKRKVTVEWEQEIRDERLVHNFSLFLPLFFPSLFLSFSLSSNKLMKNLIINIDCYNYEG